MAKKNNKRKRNHMADGAIDMLNHTDIADGVWGVFAETGEAGYYLLYKALNGDDKMPK